VRFLNHIVGKTIAPSSASPVQQGPLHPHLLPPLLSLVPEDEAQAWSRKRCRRLRSALSGTQSRQHFRLWRGRRPTRSS
jgi:hypothetical protein